MSLMHRQRWFKSVGIVIFLTAFGSACSKDMQEQPSFAPQEAPRKHSPTGSVPRESRAVELSKLKTSEEIIELGASLFAINCAHCHGRTGNGDGSVADYLKERPANLHGAAQKKAPSEVYEIVTIGRDAMPSFQGELSTHERWAVAYFVKSFSPEPTP